MIGSIADHYTGAQTLAALCLAHQKATLKIIKLNIKRHVAVTKDDNV